MFTSHHGFLFLVIQVEETSREREERLKGWSTFLGVENATADSSKGETHSTENQNTTTQVIEEQAQQEEQKEEHKGEQPEGGEKEKGDTEGGMASTDSSLAGSDDEDV